MEKKRLDYLDMAKGIGIILVVIAHSPYTSERVQAFITAFHMPLFYIVSGMLICHTGEERRDFKTIVKKKAKGVMAPYLCFSLLYMLIDLILMYARPGRLTWTDMHRAFIEFVTLYGISVMWFLSALFFGELIFFFLKKKCAAAKRPELCMALAGVVSAVILTGGSALFHRFYPLYKSMPILWAGYFLIVLLRSFGVVSFLVLGYGSFKWYFGKSGGRAGAELFAGILCLLLAAAVSGVNGVVDLHFLVFANPLLYYLGAAAGSAGVILLCRRLKRGRALHYLGKNSLIIMATHLDFQVLITAINFANWVNQYVTRAKVYVLYFNIAAAVVVLEIVLIYVINNFFPFILGKRRKGELPRAWKRHM